MTKVIYEGIVLSLLLSFSFSVYSGIAGDIKVTGKVLKYNKETVTLQLGLEKDKLTVPRKFIDLKESDKLRTGKMVTVVFSAEEIMEKIRRQQKK